MTVEKMKEILSYTDMWYKYSVSEIHLACRMAFDLIEEQDDKIKKARKKAKRFKNKYLYLKNVE